MWLFSLRGLTILALFVFPIIFVLLEAGLVELNLYFSTGVQNGTINRQFVIQFEHSISNPVHYFEISALIIIFIVYPLIPIVYSSERYFQERGYLNTVIENERLNKIIYLLLPFFILGILNIFRAEHVLTIPPGGIESMLLPQIFRQGTYSLTLYRIVTFVATLIFASALLKTTFLSSKREFSFYYAQACMKLVSKKEHEDEKMRYLIKGIKSYNTYLSKEFRCQIDYFRIYTKIINSPTKERTESMNLITEAFEGDKLGVVNHLTRCLEDKEQILPANSFEDRLRHLGTYVGGIIGAIVGIVGVIGKH